MTHAIRLGSERNELPTLTMPRLSGPISLTTVTTGADRRRNEVRIRVTGCPHRFAVLAHTLGGLPMASDPPWPKMHPLEPNWIRRLRRRLRR